MSNHNTNALIHSTSPYLLQHAHNPVNWQPWDDQLIKGKNNNKKLLLVSIGYAACHWCHVMEHESFEDKEVAKVMNENFICIKVDREERPDVDNYYMTALHLMGLQGGWPLNVVALPDGQPIWGGTYFPKKTWMNNIFAVAQFWKENKDKVVKYAQDLQSGIEQTLLSVSPSHSSPVQSEMIEQSVKDWKKHFDFENGGRNGHPKFPMPVNLDFLLYFGAIKNDARVLDFVMLTLDKMAFGGIYDQIGGGFARYATDEKWKVPHFEKMLYDNGQLIGIYSKGYQQYKQEEYKKVVYETVRFIEREMMNRNNAFFSSLDADSEGEEGKFYVWTREELIDVIKDDFELFVNYFNLSANGSWEKGNYILQRDMTDDDFATRNDLTLEELHVKTHKWKELLLQERNKRIRPELDDKTLLSWNALVIQGLTDAYKAFKDPYFKQLAFLNAGFIKQNMMESNGKIFHSWKNGTNAVYGFIDDYALVIQAFNSLFEISGKEEWLLSARHLLDFTIQQFYDQDKALFLYSKKEVNPAVPNFFQIEDNVIPAANSIMADNLFKIYLLYGENDYKEIAEKMLHQVVPHFSKYPYAFANWGKLMLKMTENFYEVAVCGENAEEKFLELQSEYNPNVLWAIASKKSNISLLKNRYKPGETLIYVCRNRSCLLPVTDIDEALKQLGH